jgi:hypothetical protein
MYAIASHDDHILLEMIYLDETQREGGEGRLPKFTQINYDQLRGDYAWYFLFPLPPGTQPDRIHTGRTDVSLRDLDITAPN